MLDQKGNVSTNRVSAAPLVDVTMHLCWLDLGVPRAVAVILASHDLGARLKQPSRTCAVP